ncbi:Copper resistance protein D [Sphingomonas aurantiaca]|uniref:Copper resistance protein D n=1 Tax=Sphingomonas aurantiaca TaxID=185949 RepID=A0A5E7XYF9_9SPHN|nr:MULTISPECIES: copper homeostasis membrane protein CopD [Sphingomonas]MBB3589266.1 putative copper resistance protein D [Sphingomonas sp. BK481]MCP8891428.1 copper homeostasis membrane protein CopD [Sphingomonas faeni]VVS99266.1 Copper resistance protein D [Sphingomonas aurantiaca]VXC99790.1 Copper resistance protein D [Sphingomonas sp. T1]
MDTDWPLIAVRFALYATLSGLFGLSAFSLYGLKARERADALALRPWLVGSGLLGLLFSGIGLALLAAAMAGAPLWPVDQEAVGMLLSGSATGTAWEARVAALVVASIAALVAAGRAALLGLVAFAAGVALATLAWAGHGAMDEGAVGWVHLGADILHLLAGGAWAGALLGLVLLVARPAGRVDAAHLTLTHRALHGFGLVGTIMVGTIAVTGIVNAWLLVGVANLPNLAATVYGQLLIAKLVLFGAMLTLASFNRFRLTPAFERSITAVDHHGALRGLRRSLAVEASCAVAILALVAWLGTLEPPASAM